MKRKPFAAAALWVLLTAVLSGCLYPDDYTPGAGASAHEAVLLVQDAVDRYYKQTGLLPIENADDKTPLYEKFKIDFGKLKRTHFLTNVPTLAFENGGTYIFLIIDEETKPTVKLMDLAAYQQVGEVQRKVDDYVDSHGGLPSGPEMYPGMWAIDFGKLGASDPGIRSMFSQQTLPLMVDSRGRVYLDYGADLHTALQKAANPPKAGDDLRRLLVDQSYFVPVKSPVYRLAGGEPQAVPDASP